MESATSLMHRNSIESTQRQQYLKIQRTYNTKQHLSNPDRKRNTIIRIRRTKQPNRFHQICTRTNKRNHIVSAKSAKDPPQPSGPAKLIRNVPIVTFISDNSESHRNQYKPLELGRIHLIPIKPNVSNNTQ